ncbi:MAG: hypothetical protein KatS3mg031_0747 [Chitinophagales bacterium]|nr:MAG: hypothetical protein KatS3mg031_0747 [Chitinophagales bacterium]
MKHALLLIKMLLVFSLTSAAQTCVGVFTIGVYDKKNQKPLAEKVQKNIWYVFTHDENEFYEETQPVQPLDTIFRYPEVYRIRHNEKGYNFISTDSQAQLMFPTLCGLYLIHFELINKKDTMRISLYNIPAHQSFQIDSLFFEKGDFIADFQGSDLLGEFNFLDDKGYFVVPASFVQPLKQEDEPGK